jgi:hypothetical protein
MVQQLVSFKMASSQSPVSALHALLRATVIRESLLLRCEKPRPKRPKWAESPATGS